MAEIRLVRSDGWLLAAVTEGRGRPKKLWELLHDADWLNRSIPTFDELSFGLPRLVAAGYVIVAGAGPNLRVQPTDKARHSRKGVDKRAKTIGDVLGAFNQLVGARSYPLPEYEDRSLGRLSDLSPSDLDDALSKYNSWFWQRADRVVGASRLVRWLTRRR